MPWDKHDMQIVGEASNGKKALEFLCSNEVDLALVDLDMPIMNGITFISKARSLYPNLNYVVLTVHTEFEYIQKVLRLGAIDYIVKTHFDQEDFDSILERIKASISKKNSSIQKSSNPKWKESKILYSNIYALVTVGMEPETDESIFQFWELNELVDFQDIYEIIPGVWVFTDNRHEFVFPENFSNIMLLRISDVNDLTYTQLGKLLRNYKNDQFFYDYQPVRKINHKRAYELQENIYIIDNTTFETLKRDWVSLNWIHENELFDKIKLDLKNSKLKFSQLYHLLLTLENVWNTSYSKMAGQTLELPSSFQHWSEVENWLIQIYEKTDLIDSKNRYPSEITKSILLAKQYIDTHFFLPIDTTEIARNAHMSYTYFSRCFHDIVGISFSNYCTQSRINQAKEYLLLTSNSIQQIAFDVGYKDEKYFSRIFKKNTGLTPSSYRKSKNEGVIDMY